MFILKEAMDVMKISYHMIAIEWNRGSFNIGLRDYEKAHQIAYYHISRFIELYSKLFATTEEETLEKFLYQID